MKGAIFPRNASTFSAFGLLTANLKNSGAQSLMVPLDQASERSIEDDFRKLESNARAFLDKSANGIERVYADRWADVRYLGQSHEVAVPVDPTRVDLNAMFSDFERLHERLYGTKLGDAAEIVNIRVTITGQVTQLKAQPFQPAVVNTKPTGERLTGFSKKPAPIFWRDGLPPGWRHEGTCLIEEVDSVVYIPDGVVEVDQYGSLCLA
jgi:N-methylhydantoinase A